MASQGDLVEGALNTTETTEQNIGTITLPSSGVSRIVGVYCIGQGNPTTDEVMSIHFRLSFKTVPGVFKFPGTMSWGNTGTVAGGSNYSAFNIIPVNIPVGPNETITCFATGTVAQSDGVRCIIGVIFE